MHCIEILRFAHRQMLHFGCNDTQAVLLEAAVNLADDIFCHCIRLDNGNGTLNRPINVLISCCINNITGNFSLAGYFTKIPLPLVKTAADLHFILSQTQYFQTASILHKAV